VQKPPTLKKVSQNQANEVQQSEECNAEQFASEYRQASLEWDSGSDAQIWERATGDGIL
jgi:hypothetical protein